MCHRPKGKGKLDVVSGNYYLDIMDQPFTCRSERNNDGLCGKTAQYFEPKKVWWKLWTL